MLIAIYVANTKTFVSAAGDMPESVISPPGLASSAYTPVRHRKELAEENCSFEEPADLGYRRVQDGECTSSQPATSVSAARRIRRATRDDSLGWRCSRAPFLRFRHRRSLA